MKTNINSGLIQERVKCLNSSINEHDSHVYYERALHNMTGQKMLSFIEHCTDPYNANKYTRNCIYFLEKANTLDEATCKKITNTFVNSVLPYVKDTADVSFLTTRYQLSEAQESLIKEQVEKLDIADRIANNHQQISKRFNVDKWFHKGTSGIYLERSIDRYCQNMDTYDCPSDQKFGLYLEHLFYILQKDNIPHDPVAVTEQVLDYFLYRDAEITKETYTKYQQVLEDCPMVDAPIVNSMSYFCTGFNSEKDPFKKDLKLFDINPNKSGEDILQNINNLMDSKSTRNLADNFGDLILRLRKLAEYSTTSMQCIADCCKAIITKLNERSIGHEITREDIKVIVGHIDEAIKSVDIMCYDMDDLPESSDRLFELKDMLKEMKEAVCELLAIIVSSKNMAEINALESCEETMTLSEFSFFKFNNILNSCRKIDKFLKEKGRKYFNKASKKVKEIKGAIFEYNIDLDRCISDNNQFDYCMTMFEIPDDTDLSELIDGADDLCHEARNFFHLENGVHLYYKLTNMLEFHIGFEKRLILSESQQEDVSSKLSYPDLARAIMIQHESNVVDSFSDIHDLIDDVEDRIPTVEETALIIELSKYIPSQDFDNIRSIAEAYAGDPTIDKAVSEWAPIEAPYDIVEEASGLLYALMESKEDKDKINDEKKRKKEEAAKKPSIAERIKNSATKKKEEISNTVEDEQKKFKGIHLNDIKLYIAALRKKMHDMSAKEKQMARNLDTYMGMLQKNIKDALISDRREAIIKGSVIPSFSKAMKVGIALAGVTIVAPPVGIIAAVGGLAMSKDLTRKERMLLLDELEVEMEVIDKEIELAQNRNQIKRYRQLLQYKKKCQREYQRIKYNIKAKQDVPFSSDLGVKSNYSD